MKKLRRWTKQWNVYPASERQTRKAIQEMRGSVDVGAEMVQTISECGGENVLVPAAFSWVKNLYVLIIQQLDQLHSHGLLTWHNTNAVTLPKNEIWLKFGGDKGGGTFKFCYQIVNRDRPNSTDNTVVASCLMADDSLPNIRLATQPFHNIIAELNRMKWR